MSSVAPNPKRYNISISTWRETQVQHALAALGYAVQTRRIAGRPMPLVIVRAEAA